MEMFLVLQIAYLSLQVTYGLGESETVYSIASAIYNAGQIITSLVVIVTIRWLGTRFFLLTYSLCHVFGFILYRWALNGAAIITARCFIGMAASMIPVTLAYFGSTASEYQLLCDALGTKCDKHITKKLIGYFCISSSGFSIITSGTVLMFNINIYSYNRT